MQSELGIYANWDISNGCYQSWRSQEQGLIFDSRCR